MHIGTGLVCGYKILDMVNAGFDFTILLADWHAWINNKFGGSLKTIRYCGEYFIEAFSSIGLTKDKVKYVWASDLVKREGYWETVVRVAKKSNLSRVIRCLPIMGRELKPTDVETAYLFYPCMQVTDIFMLQVDCACAGMDQRKAHMLARDTAEKLSIKKPVCLHTHLLLSLAGFSAKPETQYDEDERLSLQIGTKMSKSKPKGCIFIHDSPEEIKSKILDAYCPPKQADGNPVLEIVKYVIFAKEKSFLVEREAKYGGSVEFSSYEELEKSYVEGKLHPLDLKNSVAETLTRILEPVRAYFKGKEDMVKKISKL
jgi:tyrosyl-tRNA synthetase